MSKRGPLPNEVKIETRGNIGDYFQKMRENVPPVLTSLAQATTQRAASDSPGGASGKVGGSLTPEPARPTGPDKWESAIISSDAKLFYWHEFGTGQYKEGGGEKYPITATRPHRMLVFEKEGKVRFIRGKAGAPAVVRHPGVKATKMLRNAIDYMLPRYLQIFEQLGLDVEVL